MSRWVVAASLAALLLVLGVVLAVAVPWDPLPGATAEPVQVDRDFSPAERAREDAFHSDVRPPAYASLAVSLLVAAALGLTPLGARVVAVVARPFGGGWVWQVLIGTVALVALGRLVTLPFAVHSEQALRRYGLSTQTWPSWLADLGKSLAVGSLVTAVALLVLVGLARRLSTGWELVGAAAVAGLVALGSYGWPLVVEPLFYRFTPLPPGEQRDALLELAARDGVAVDEVLVADASRRTTAVNAYVSGLGGSRRVVVYDTLLRTATQEEVELVVAHELGHVTASDVRYGTLLGASGAAAGVLALGLLLRWEPLLRRAGADGPADPRVVPVVLLLVSVGSLLVAPVSNVVSRRIEARADVHSLELTRDVSTFIDSERRLARSNLSDLDRPPLVTLLFATHPTAPQRIALARAWAQREGVPVP